MAYLCPHQCDGKTEYGYCRYTCCVNPLHSNWGTAQQGQGVQRAVITNYDSIRAKSVEEMAEFLTLIMMGEERSVPFIYSTVDKWLDWLKQEVDDAD